MADVSTAKVFIKVDTWNGYWHVMLDKDSSKLTTFNTPFGRYRWKRVPFGISAASEIFQKRILQALEQLQRLIIIHDDMIVNGVGDSIEEATSDHNTNLANFLMKCWRERCQAEQKKVRVAL